MAWEEWELLKADVVQRHSTRMQLNQLNDGAGDGSASGVDGGTLQHTDQPWRHAAGVAAALHSSMNTAKRDLSAANEGTASGLEGLVSLASLSTILKSWDDRLSAVQKECNILHPLLLSVSKELGEMDRAVAAQASSISVLSWGGA